MKTLCKRRERMNLDEEMPEAYPNLQEIKKKVNYWVSNFKMLLVFLMENSDKIYAYEKITC